MGFVRAKTGPDVGNNDRKSGPGITPASPGAAPTAGARVDTGKPAGGIRSAGLKSAGPKSAGPKSAGPKSAGMKSSGMHAPAIRKSRIPAPFFGISPSLDLWSTPLWKHFPKDEEEAVFHKTIYRRDGNTCQCCGFQAPDGIGLMPFHIDGNHDNNKADNLSSICLFCHVYWHPISMTTIATAIPDVSEAEFSHIGRTLHIAGQKVNEDPELYDTCLSVYLDIEKGASYPFQYFGSHFSSAIATAFIHVGDRKKPQILENMKKLRLYIPELFFSNNGVEEEYLEVYIKEIINGPAYSSLPMKSWRNL